MESLIPSIVVFGSAAALFVIVGLAIRGWQRGPRARARREVTWTRAGTALVHLDSAIAESDIELGLAGALYGGTAPRTLAIARARAANVRDAAFARYQDALDRKETDTNAVRDARKIGDTAAKALLVLEGAQAEHKQWLTMNADAPAQVQAARAELESLRESLGDTHGLENDLAARFADSEVAPVRAAMQVVRDELAAAEVAIDRAEEAMASPGASVVADLTVAQKCLRTISDASTTADRAYRAVIDASLAVNDEIASVRADVARGIDLQDGVSEREADRMRAELEVVVAAIEKSEPRAAAEPTAVVAEIARVRDRLDLALGSARSARDRLEGARSALPPTIAAARNAIAHAEAVVAQSSSADARVRLTAAHDAMTASRTADDAVAALDAVRRAMRHAEDAEALANYARGGLRRE